MRRSTATSTVDRSARTSAPKFRFVGGKGGVGKTTCAAAYGLASARRGERTLLISIDPAPSLGDALRQPLGPVPRPVRGARGLHAVELDATVALERWLAGRRDTLEAIAVRGTWLDHDDVSRLLRLSLPGIDEIAALLQIAAFEEDPGYERVVVDSAPTGHMLRMLRMPAGLEVLAQVFDRMQAKHRIMVEALRGAYRPDAADALIQELGRQARNMGALLRDRSRARLSWVTLPEAMAVEESADAIRSLRVHGIEIDALVVNQVTPVPPQRCRWCTARRTAERQVVDRFRRSFLAGTVPVATVPAVATEPRGLEALARIGASLDRPRARLTARVRPAPAPVSAQLPQGDSGRAVPSLATPALRLLMFGGKGGVGKTTCACAAALEAAAAPPRRRVLLLSVDPAHSLGDALGQPLSDVPRRVRDGLPNLTAREIDAGRVFDRLRQQIGDGIEELFGRIAAGAGGHVPAHDRDMMRDLVQLAPPGLDELVAVMEVLENLAPDGRRPAHDLLVIDTAPTGHALRLLEMPALVHSWVKEIMTILLKYEPVVGVGDLGATLLRLSKGLGRLRELLADPVRTEFVVVTRAGGLPRAETVRLLRRLAAARVSAPLVIVNAVGAGTCSRCRSDRAAQAREIAQLRRELARIPDGPPRLVLAPAQLPPPHRWRRLEAWRRTWYELAPPQ